MSEGISDLSFVPPELLVTQMEKNKKPLDSDQKQKDLEERRNKCFDRLEDIGIISRVHNNQGEELIVLENLDIFTKDRYSGYDKVKGKRIEMKASDVLKNYCGPISYSEKFGRNNMQTTLFLLFKDSKVITREDADKVSLAEGGKWSKKEVPAKDLFYIPTNKEDAFDLEKVRNSEYYFLLPQIGKRWITTYPTRNEGFESGLNSIETTFTAMIYNNGRGMRNSEGVLMVDEKTNRPSKRQAISARWFEANFGSKIVEIETARGLLAKYGDNLTKNKLLMETDFRETKKKGEKEEVSKAGNWYDNGVVYYLGKNLTGCYIERLSNEIVAVVDVGGEIKKMFNTNFDERARSGFNPYYTETGTLITQVPELVMKGAEVNQEGKVSLYRFDMEGNRYADEEKMARVGSKLVDFFNLTGIDNKARRSLKLEDSMGVFRQYEGLDERNKELYIKLIKDHGLVALLNSHSKCTTIN